MCEKEREKEISRIILENNIYRSNVFFVYIQITQVFYIFQNTTSPKNPTAKLLSQPSISITPLPRTTSQTSIPGSGTSSKSGGKSSFVICEICDGYIKVFFIYNKLL